MPTMQNLKDFVMKHGKQFVNMSLPLHMGKKEVFYFGDWIKKPGVSICSCNDGLRPVILKLKPPIFLQH